MYKCKDRNELKVNLKKILKKYNEVILQELITGREFTCGVIERGNKLIALPPTEVILIKSEMFDYHAKYTPGACLEITPAEIPAKLTKQIQDIAIKVHKVIGCKDISRTDVIVNTLGELVVLEINTIPGMTGTSFIPKQLKAKGISFQKFVDIIFNNHK